MDASTGITLGLLVASLFFGLRHGIDWDHIVAITDIAATQETKRRGLFVGTMYVLGHASVVILLGIGAIALGATIPGWLDAVAGRLVGVTLVALGLIVLLTLVLERGSFRARSRWMILFDMSRRVFSRGSDSVAHSHEHVAAESGHHDGSEDLVDGPSRIAAPTHSHSHAHDGNADYTNKGAVGIGAIHGVGAETPTQVVVFLAAASAGGVAAGLAVLLTFVVGLIISNSVITLASVYGFASVSKRQSVQVGMGIFTAVMSIGIGVLFLMGNDGALPAFFAG
jgi:high-affinity nickel-transport protein